MLHSRAAILDKNLTIFLLFRKKNQIFFSFFEEKMDNPRIGHPSYTFTNRVSIYHVVLVLGLCIALCNHYSIIQCAKNNKHKKCK